MKAAIKEIKACEILSTSARPTIETSVLLDNGVVGTASVPFGTSAGTHEAVTLIDSDSKRYRGRGMLKAIDNVHSKIAGELLGVDATDQKALDEHLVSLDPTPQRKTLGGNAILSISLACARAAANARGVSLYRHISEAFGLAGEPALPKPMVVMIEGGCHADNSTDLQEYLVGVTRDMRARDNVRAVVEVYFALGDILKAKGYSINVGLEGAYAPTAIASNEEPLQHITKAIGDAGYKAGEDLGIAMDPAASEFHKEGHYVLERERKQLTSDEMITYYEDLVDRYPIFSIEDGLGEDDWKTWPEMNKRLGDKIIVMGDDLTVTNVQRLQRAIDTASINAILIKPNQVGTLSETIAAMELARKHELKTVVSHRGGGETTDTFIIDLATAAGADFVKVGITRGERVVKYNRLMEIGDELGL